MNNAGLLGYIKAQDDPNWCHTQHLVSLVRNASHVTKGFGYQWQSNSFDVSATSEDMQMVRLSEYIFLIATSRGPELHLNLVQLAESNLILLQQEVRTPIMDPSNLRILGISNTNAKSQATKFVLLFENRNTHRVYALMGTYSNAKFAIVPSVLRPLYEPPMSKPFVHVNATMIALGEHKTIISLIGGPLVGEQSVFQFVCDSNSSQLVCDTMSSGTQKSWKNIISGIQINKDAFIVQTREETILWRASLQVENNVTWQSQILSIPAIPTTINQGPFIKSFGRYWEDDWLLLYFVNSSNNLELFVYSLERQQFYKFTIAAQVSTMFPVQISMAHDECALIVTYASYKLNKQIGLFVRAFSLIQSSTKTSIVMEKKETEIVPNLTSNFVVVEAKQMGTELPLVLILIPSQRIFHALFVHGGARPYAISLPGRSSQCTTVEIRIRGSAPFNMNSKTTSGISYYGNKDGTFADTEFAKDDLQRLPEVAQSIGNIYWWIDIK